MTYQTGIKQIVIIAAAGLIINIGVGILNSVRATNQDHYTVVQNEKDLAKLSEDLKLKADAERIGEIMVRMKEYHDLAMKSIDSNDEKTKAELERINNRIDNLLSKYNTIRGIK